MLHYLGNIVEKDENYEDYTHESAYSKANGKVEQVQLNIVTI